MGTYIYGRTQQVRTVKTSTGGAMEINLAKFLFKEYTTFIGQSRIEGLQAGLCTRYDNAWEDRALPRFMIVADKFSAYAEHAVYDTQASKNGAVPSTFTEYDDHGEHVGDITKVAGRWLFTPKTPTASEVRAKEIIDRLKVEKEQAAKAAPALNRIKNILRG